jgi:hypothetical protein
MNPYNQNDEFVKIDENYINGYLTPIAMFRDFTTGEVGFNYYFKKLKSGSSITESIFAEFRLSLKNSGRFTSDEQVEALLNKWFELEEIENWETNLATEIDFWTGKSITDTIKDENRIRAWHDKPNLLSLNLIEVLKVFFYPKTMKAYKYNGTIKNDLYYHWGGLKWLDIIFSNQEETYLLHFDLSD